MDGSASGDFGCPGSTLRSTGGRLEGMGKRWPEWAGALGQWMGWQAPWASVPGDCMFGTKHGEGNLWAQAQGRAVNVVLLERL